jgi:hypothetical protein
VLAELVLVPPVQAEQIQAAEPKLLAERQESASW